MKSLLAAILLDFTITGVACAPSCVAAGLSDHVEFRERMLSRVGKRVLVVGVANLYAKFGAWISVDDWGVYIYPHTGAETKSRGNIIHHHNVKVTGVLHHQNEVRTDGLSTGIPEHFYFRLDEITVLDLGTPPR